MVMRIMVFTLIEECMADSMTQCRWADHRRLNRSCFFVTFVKLSAVARACRFRRLSPSSRPCGQSRRPARTCRHWSGRRSPRSGCRGSSRRWPGFGTGRDQADVACTGRPPRSPRSGERAWVKRHAWAKARRRIVERTHSWLNPYRDSFLARPGVDFLAFKHDRRVG